MSVALITGGSAGLGRAVLEALTELGWTVVTDGRDGDRLADIASSGVVRVPGDIADPRHRGDLVAEVDRLGRLDLLMHNASTLGPLPLRPLRELSGDDLIATWSVNAVAPHELTRALLPRLRDAGGVIVSVSSDAAVDHYPTWGAYGAGKAALDHLTATWAVEEDLLAYAVDPGDLRTALHQAAFPGEDISDRPLPATVVPAFLEILRRRPPSGRYRAADFLPVGV